MERPLLVSTQWLQDHLNDPAVEIIENAWVADSYSKAHIKGAFRVPGHPYLKKFTDNGERTRHVMAPEAFSGLCHALGLKRDKHYVIYDDYYGLFAARFWCVCRHFGLNNISILDGSWRGWLAQGRPVSSRMETPLPGTDIVVRPHACHFIGREELQSIYREPGVQLWDTRRIGEYTGEEQTENQRKGHIPEALNLEWTDLLTEPVSEGDPRFLKPVRDLEMMLVNLGLRRDRTIITYCQSGNRAAFCNLVLELLDYPRHRLYDASMSEWARDESLPVETD